MLKLKMMLCVMMLPLVVVGCHHGQSVSQCVKLPPPRRGHNAASPRLADTEGRLFLPSERGWIIMQKQLEGTQKYINDSAERVAHIRWATHGTIVSNTHALPAEYKCSVNKTEQSIYECLLGFCFNNIFAPPQILAASTVFFCPIPETKK